MGVQDEINAMLTALENPSSNEEEQEETHEESEKEEEEKKEEQKEESTEKKEEEKEEEKKEEEKEEIDEETKQKADLEAKEKSALEKLNTEKAERIKQEEETRKAEEEAERKRKEDEKPPTFEPHDFIGDLDVDEVTRSKEGLNKLLNMVYSKGVADSQKMASEKVLMSIPDIVSNNIRIINALKEASDNFYKANEDLKPFPKVVAVVFEEMLAKNPGRKYDEIFPDVATEVRKRLDLHKVANKVNKKEDPPRLPNKKGGGSRPDGKPNLSPMQSEIESMNKSLGR